MTNLLKFHYFSYLAIGLLSFVVAFNTINTLPFTLMILLTFLASGFVWLGMAKFFEAQPFQLNQTKAQHILWMNFTHYLIVIFSLATMLLFDDNRFAWLENGSRLYAIIVSADASYYMVQLFLSHYYDNQPVNLASLLHHFGFTGVFMALLLLHHWEYTFLWLIVFNLSHGIPFTLYLILKSAKDPRKQTAFFVQYAVWMLLRVFIFTLLMLFYVFVLDKSHLPALVYWSGIVPFTFIMNIALTLFWTIEMSRISWYKLHRMRRYHAHKVSPQN